MVSFVMFYLISFGPKNNHFMISQKVYASLQECNKDYPRLKREKGASKFACVKVNLR